MDSSPRHRTVPVILNPGARSARAAGRVDAIRALSPSVKLWQTSSAGEARRFAASLAASGEPLVVACGGDGTVNEVINGIADGGGLRRTALGLLPAGTMNVFAAELGLPTASLEECWRVIERGHHRLLDLWTANGIHFAQLAGAGFDAGVIRDTPWERKKLLGPLSYILAGIGNLRKSAPLLRVTAPGRDPVEGTTVLLGNGRQYGGPFRVFPDASPTDGLIDALVLHSHNAAQLLRLTFSVLAGPRLPGSRLSRFQAPSLTIESPAPFPFQTDGEFSGSAPRLDVRPAPFPLRILA